MFTIRQIKSSWLKRRTWYDRVLWRKTLSAKYIEKTNGYKCTIGIDKVFSLASGFAYKAHINGYHSMNRRAYSNVVNCLYDVWGATETDEFKYIENLQRIKERENSKEER